MKRLSLSEWIKRADEHRAKAEKWTIPYRERKSRHSPHPILDFLFVYYRFPLSKVEAWHPGMDYELECDEMPATYRDKHYQHEGGLLKLDPSLMLEKERQRLQWSLELLQATQSRSPNFGCHGMHEWAMVYQGQVVRHETCTKLRLPQDEIDAFVRSQPICCSHFDAFRFFAPEARPFNRLQPQFDERERMEQPACIHANMDLYKWAYKAMPWIGTDLLWKCFELALRYRDLDMRASPYDLLPWGYPPLLIETEAGRKQYEQEQRALAQASTPLREELILALTHVLRFVKA